MSDSKSELAKVFFEIFVPRKQYDAEMAALKAQIDTLKAHVSELQGRVISLNSDIAPMRLIGGGPRTIPSSKPYGPQA